MRRFVQHSVCWVASERDCLQPPLLFLHPVHRAQLQKVCSIDFLPRHLREPVETVLMEAPRDSPVIELAMRAMKELLSVLSHRLPSIALLNRQLEGQVPQFSSDWVGGSGSRDQKRFDLTGAEQAFMHDQSFKASRYRTWDWGDNLSIINPGIVAAWQCDSTVVSRSWPRA